MVLETTIKINGKTYKGLLSISGHLDPEFGEIFYSWTLITGKHHITCHRKQRYRLHDEISCLNDAKDFGIKITES